MTITLKSFITASVITIAAATSAQAADAVGLAKPMKTASAATTFSWDGVYVGGQIGGAFSKMQLPAEENASTAQETSEPVKDSDAEWMSSTIAVAENTSKDFAALTDSKKIKLSGFVGGLYLGYNHMFSNKVVLGAETDFVLAFVKKTKNDGDHQVELKQQWAEAIRVRLGYALERFLPYVAVGVAHANFKAIAGGENNDSATYTGWTAGAGVDYAITDNVIARGEYRYNDFGKKQGAKASGSDMRFAIAYKF